MGKNGGKREGAGRKGASRRTPGAMAKATKLIDGAQPRAAQVLLDALEAVTQVPRIVGRDDKGHPEYEYIEVPDYQSRIKAACALLNKRIPDVQKVTVEGGDPDKPIRHEMRTKIEVLTNEELVRRLAKK